MNTPYDVIVVGARCAGAATAMLLARAGLKVLLLDRSRPGNDTLSTHALMRGGAVLLHRWGLLEALAATGTPPVRQVRFDYGDETVTVSLKPSHGIGALRAPRRTVLDPLLVAAAAAAGAEVRYGCAVSDLLRDATGRVRGVVCRDRCGELRLPARLVVGADGARSLVARRAGAPTQRTGAGAGAVVYGYWSGLETVGYEWFYRQGASAGFIPTHRGEVCVFAGTTADRFRSSRGAGDLAGAYHRLLEAATGDAAGRLAAAAGPDRLYGFPGRRSFLRQAWGPGWALVGDAGYFLDPLSTHGITDALRDAQLLARAVTAAHRGTVAEAAALAGYQRRRDHLSLPLFDSVDRIATYDWDLPALRRLHRDASAAMSAEVEAMSDLKDDALI